jgi:hypothetical protein
MRRHAPTVAIALALLLAACGSKLPRSEQEFRTLTQGWGLAGRSIEDSTAKLEEQGFHVRRLLPEPSWPDRREYLLATQTQSLVFGDREWRIILPINGGRIAEVQPYVFIHAL